MRWWEYSGLEGLVADVLTKKREGATVVIKLNHFTHLPENSGGLEVGKKWSSFMHEQPACFLVGHL